MSETANPRNKRALIALLALAVAAVAVFAVWRMASGDDDKDAVPVAIPTSTSAPTAEPTASPTPTKKKPKCEGPNTDLADLPGDSLLPDCGAPVVSIEQEKETGLGLGCGGNYPVILYKTTTSASDTSICGTTSSGEDFRMVTQKRGGPVLDMPGDYDPQRDAFVAKKDGTSYAVLAYDGTLIVTKNGKSTTEDSDNDWISLDNEDDID